MNFPEKFQLCNIIFLRCSIAGSMLGWIDILQGIRKHTAPEGLKYIDYWITQVEPVDAALKRGDVAGVATIFRDVIPVIRQLIPHLNDEKLQVSVGAIADNAENLLKSLEAKGAGMSGLPKFFESESKNLGGILRTLIHKVFGLVKMC